MRYLIDTNIFLYVSMDIELLSSEVLHIFEDYNNTFYISAESLKELVLFYRKQKKKPKQWKNETDMLLSIEKNFGLKTLPVKHEHIITYSKLQLNTEHNDPSDHIIISQAITEKLTLISSDRKFNHYTKQKLAFVFNKK